MKVKVSSVSKAFKQGPNQVEPLKDVHFEISPSEITALVGSSGSGKSTLFSLLSGVQEPSTGQIWLDDIAWHKLPADKKTQFRGANIGVIFQSHLLIPHLTALENVMLPLELQNPKADIHRGKKILEQVGLGHRCDHFPSQLSGGEAQRVAIARALVHEPRLILADEPTGQLDNETAAQVVQLMFDLFKKSKATVILITHDMDLAQRCDTILHLKNGIVSQEKTLPELNP